MTALVAHPPFRMNWPRVGALSGTMALHAGLLLLLLAPPVALKVMQATHEDTLTFRWIEPEKIPDEPVLPVPKVKVPTPPQPRHIEQPPPQTAPTPPLIAENPMGQPAEPAGPPAPEMPAAPVETAPTALAYNFRTKVAYPIKALQRGEHGTVVLRVLVGADGNPQTIEIERSSGSRDLDNAARDAVKRWTFQPGTHNGVKQSAWARVPISFDLQQL
jgi:protein TonB